MPFGEMPREWKSIVNRVLKWEKMIVCGKLAWWWNGEVKDRIN